MTSLLPQISDGVVAFIRVAYGVLLVAMLVGMLPQARRFFLSDRWGGYAKSSRAVDAIQNPVIMPITLAIWLGCGLLLIVGAWTTAAALVNFLLARYFCIWMRWRGVLRGMGAPGFMLYWLAAAVFLLELTTNHAPELRPLALLVLQLDLAFIFLAAALYKLRSGYLRNNGMEFGLTNPQWGYWWRAYRRLPPTHPVLRALNQMAWITELAAAVAMLFPPTRFFGGLLLIITFAFIATQIRLALLCEMVMLAGVLFFAPDTVGGRLIDEAVHVSPADVSVVPAAAIQLGTALIVAYAVLLPFAYGGLIYNFYFRKRLAEPIQGLLERYTNFFGIILWRVFSADLVNFMIEIGVRPREAGASALLSNYRNALFSRFAHVCEMIAITSVFTTLKYYPSNSELFKERLLRYARTLPCPDGSVLTFEYQSIRKGADEFEFAPVAEFVVDPRAGDIVEKVIDPGTSVRAISEHSPVHEGVRPGSYAPPV